jgi:hypothetical protein
MKKINWARVWYTVGVAALGLLCLAMIFMIVGG